MPKWISVWHTHRQYYYIFLWFFFGSAFKLRLISLWEVLYRALQAN